MEFEVNNIKLTNFRNHINKEFGPFKKINIFVGPNGVGKSNILEAINLTTSISSFRHAKNDSLINIQNNSYSIIQTGITNKSSSIKHNIKLQIKPDNKQVYLDDKKQTIINLKGKYPSISFCPDDLMYVKQNNSERRHLIDTLGSQLSKNYYTVRKDYSRALRQKNQSLKQQADKEIIQSLNDVLVIAGAQLICYRRLLINKINPLLTRNYSKISASNEAAILDYEPCVAPHPSSEKYNRDQIRELLRVLFKNNLNKEMMLKRSIVGPHKDRFIFKINDCDSSDFASQGQQRSIALSFKLAEVALIENILSCQPILLLDDVISELDCTRTKSLLEIIENCTQTFITSTSLSSFSEDFLLKSNVFTI